MSFFLGSRGIKSVQFLDKVIVSPSLLSVLHFLHAEQKKEETDSTYALNSELNLHPRPIIALVGAKK